MTTQSLTVERDRPQLQLALDFVSLNDALRTASAVHPHFDIAEIGTPLIIEEGLRALEELKGQPGATHRCNGGSGDREGRSR